MNRRNVINEKKYCWYPITGSNFASIQKQHLVVTLASLFLNQKFTHSTSSCKMTFPLQNIVSMYFASYEQLYIDLNNFNISTLNSFIWMVKVNHGCAPGGLQLWRQGFHWSVTFVVFILLHFHVCWLKNSRPAVESWHGNAQQLKA